MSRKGTPAASTNVHTLKSEFDPTLLAVNAERAATMIGLSRSMFYKLLRTGRIGPRAIRLGKAVRFSVRELEEWVAVGMPAQRVWMQRRS